MPPKRGRPVSASSRRSKRRANQMRRVQDIQTEENNTSHDNTTVNDLLVDDPPRNDQPGDVTLHASDDATPSTLPSDLISQIVSKVTQEVTATLIPLVGDMVRSSQPAASTTEQHPPPNVQSGTDMGFSLVAGQRLGEQAAGTSIGDAVNQAHNLVTGNRPQPSRLFSSSSLPVDSRIPEKIKVKIWNNEYIDLGSLLTSPHQDNQFRFTLSNLEQGANSALCLEPANKPRKIYSMETWNKAFRIFAGILTQKCPEDGPGLWKYMDTIHDLAARGQDWKFYDENYRFLRQSDKSGHPWGHIHMELWLKSFYNSRPKSSARNSSELPSGRSGLQPRISMPAGFCYKFHKGADCSGCAFKHDCFKCGGNHRGLNCNFRGFTAKQNSSSNYRNSPPAAKSQGTNSSKH